MGESLRFNQGTMISVIIPWKNTSKVREENLKNTIDCLAKQTEQRFELCLVEKELPYFNKSWLLNIGARQAKYEHLVFLDAEMLFENDLLGKILVEAKKYKAFICWDRMIINVGRDNPTERLYTPKTSQNLGGCWYFDKDYYFNEFGGMCENFKGYGAEDNEAWDRLRYVFEVPIPRLDYTLIHQYHDWTPVEDTAGTDYRENLRLWKFSKGHPRVVIDYLKQAGVGKSESPTFIAI